MRSNFEVNDGFETFIFRSCLLSLGVEFRVRKSDSSRNQAVALRDRFELIKALQNTERDDGNLIIESCEYSISK